MTTQYAEASYQEVIDLHTESDKVSVVGIHTPNSDTPYFMLRGFWTQFKKFKYNGCSISMVPVATLPVDPLQVSYDAGEPTIDPRDIVNPILFHGCHGDDMGAILDSLYSDDNSLSMIDMMKSDSVDHNIFPRTVIQGLGDTEVYEALYYKAMTDKTWLKAHPQRGFRKSGLRPMVYSVATTRQLASVPNSSGSLGPADSYHTVQKGTDMVTYGSSAGQDASSPLNALAEFGRPVVNPDNNSVSMSAVNRLGLITPRLQRLGWMDTRTVRGVMPGQTASAQAVSGDDTGDILARMYRVAQSYAEPTLVPKIFMGMIMLPPAYKTEQYFRLIINHSFSFARFRGASMNQDELGEWQKAYNVFNFNDPDAAKTTRSNTEELEKKEIDDNGSKDE